MKAALVCLWLLPPALFLGCAGISEKNTFVKGYHLVSPLASGKDCLEDGDVRVTVKIIEDSRFGVKVYNKTENPLRITWGNSTIMDASGAEAELAYDRESSRKTIDWNGYTVVKPGGSAAAEVYPKSHVYTDEKGETRVYPLYFLYKPGEGEPHRFSKDKDIGLMLVMEINGHARRYPIILKANQPGQ